ncbi:MAG: ice-binding family protein [Candidatus Falkowbacteria bacterium]|nr:ice-binding family protein [Candidatus Falkowbacteria bacterium]
MRKFNKSLIVIGLAVFFGLIGFSFVKPITAQAASSPSLGTAATYSILSGTTVTNVGATSISGNVGISPAGGGGVTGFGTVTFTGGGSVHDSDGPAATAQTDKNLAYANLAGQGCDTTYIGAFKDLAGETLAPGVYCATSFHLSGTLTLNGNASDVWVFKSTSDLIVSGGAAAKVVFTEGGLPCNVWWRIVSTATFDAGSSLVGNILADTSITFAAGANLDGRALARTALVSLSGNSISGPTCAPPLGHSVQFTGTINVVKTVINDNGRTKTVADFPLFINGMPVVSGETNTFLANSDKYTVTETADSNYTRSFSGDCDSNGVLYLKLDEKAFCVITNNDDGAPIIAPPVPPIIDVVKVPSPLALPDGPGTVTYNYTLHNIGTVPVTDITMVDDTCGPVTFVAGDTNNNAKLEVNETWTYRCSTTLSATHTNTVVATGWANGISAVDIANATVIVGVPVVPPLIHVTKVPSPLTLSAKGGTVTYTEKITNPGTVALSNVLLTDDKCAPLKYISGDTNKDSKLGTTETWTYTCRTSLTKTTTNTAIASGEANGLTVRDFAIVTVVVATAVPKLPNTGLVPIGGNTTGNFAILLAVIALISSSLLKKKKKRKV